MTVPTAAEELTARLAALEEFPLIEGDRVALRGVRDEDIDGLYAMFSDPQVMRYWSRGPMQARYEAVEYAERIRSGFADRSALSWVIADLTDDRFLGTCTLYEITPAHRRAALGYCLMRAHWGQGLAGEAVSLALAWGFAHLGLSRVEADVDPRNTASCRLVEKQGFRFEGVLRQRFHAAHEIQDSAMYGLLEAEWAQKMAAEGNSFVSSVD